MLADGPHGWLIVVNLVEIMLIVVGLAIGVAIKVKYAHLRNSMLEAIREQFEPQSGVVEVDVPDLRVVSQG